MRRYCSARLHNTTRTEVCNPVKVTCQFFLDISVTLCNLPDEGYILSVNLGQNADQ